VGCGPPPPIDDAPAPADGTIFDGQLELGEGEETFRPIVSGDTLLIARGCQGSQHVWLGLRTRGLDPRGTTIRLSLERASDRMLASLEFYVRLSFMPMGDYAELLALTLQIPMPDESIGVPLVLLAEVVDRAGRGARAEVPVTIAWGTEVCGAG
jgi:hypothetical protein